MDAITNMISDMCYPQIFPNIKVYIIVERYDCNRDLYVREIRGLVGKDAY